MDKYELFTQGTSHRILRNGEPMWPGEIVAVMNAQVGEAEYQRVRLKEATRALELMVEIYDAMGAPRGPSRILADHVLSKKDADNG